MKKRIVLASVLLLSLLCSACGAPQGGAAAVEAGTASQVISGEVPGLPAECTSTTSEGETLLAVDPVDPSHLHAVWTTGAYDGANTAIAAESFDSGKTWARAFVPGTGPCTGGPLDYILDQWISIDGGGRSYYGAFAGADPATMQALASSKALNGEWAAATAVDDNQQGARGLISRTSITADPATAGRAWLVWTRALNEATAGVQVARTDDGGQTWAEPVTAAKLAGGTTAAWQLLAMPSGELLLFYGEADSEATAGEVLRLAVGSPAPGIVDRAVISTDQGATWSAPVTIAALDSFAIGRGAVGADGIAYFVWSEITDQARVVMSQSVDGGRSWSGARTVAEFEAGPLRLLDIQADVAVDSEGRIGVSYYRGFSDDERVARWFSWSSNRGTRWQHVALSEPFSYDTGTGGTGDGVFGAYQGLVAMQPGFGATFIASTGDPEDPTDVVFARVLPGGR